VNKSQLQYCFFEITWQQASKHINKSIIVATLSMYRAECLVVSGEKEENESFEVPGPSLFQLVKATFRRRIILLTFWDRAVEETLLAFSTLYYSFQDPTVILQIPPCKRNKRAFNY
jgi:hypothetical protein